METTLQVTKTVPLHRWAGAAFMVGNVLFLLNKVNEMSRLFLSRRMPDVISGQDPLLILIGQAALIAGYIGYYKLYAGRAGRAGKIALRMFAGGGILLAIAHTGFISALGELLPASITPYAESFFVLVLVSLPVLILGLIWFGALNLHHRMLTPARWLPLVTGLMGFIGFFLFSGGEITATFLFFRTLFALGLAGLGLVMWLDRPDRPA